jgi:hypothetical protein
MKDKELDNRFFSYFYDLLEEYIEPKSKDMFEEIFRTVENICRSNGYWWNIKMVEADTVDDNNSN